MDVQRTTTVSGTKVEVYGPVSLADYGAPQDLDGASMQYTVRLGTYPHGFPLAYFDNLDDARLFVDAKRRQLSRRKKP